jgi:hypothetical protein
MIGLCRSWRRSRAATLVHPAPQIAALPGIAARGFTVPMRHEGE